MVTNWFKENTTILKKRFFNTKEFNEMKILLSSENDTELLSNLTNDISDVTRNVKLITDTLTSNSDSEGKKQEVYKVNHLLSKYELPNGVGGARFYQGHLVGKENMSGVWTEIVLPIGNRKIGEIFVLTICRPSFIDITTPWDLILDTRYWIHQVIDATEGIKSRDAQYATTDPRTTQIQTASSIVMQPSYNIRYFVFEWLGFGLGWNLSRSFDSTEFPLAEFQQ